MSFVVGFLVGRYSASCPSRPQPARPVRDYRQLELPFPARPRSTVDKVYDVLTLGSLALMQVMMIYWLWNKIL